MNNKILSDESLIEDYEDLVFKKVFAIRCAEESKIIFDEIRKRENTETAGKKIVEKLFNKKEHKENFQTLGKIFKKGFVFAASLVFVVIVSVSSVVVASADIREVVTDIIYHLVFEENEKYTKISVAETTDFINPELYDWEGAYAPTYMPKGFEFGEKTDTEYKHTISYFESENIIAMCLAFAAGAMLYIVSGELVPESHSVYKGKMNAIGNILGFILGLYTTIL